MEVEEHEIKRPWGSYVILQKTQFYWVKKLYIHNKARLSFQSHQKRNEVWFVLQGVICADIDGKQRTAKSGDVLFVPKEVKHRIMGIEDACVLEVAFGKVLERDIIRYEDDYGRA
jgi:mannose-6-phosphate isomerase-like protein (cupin superfamily)